MLDLCFTYFFIYFSFILHKCDFLEYCNSPSKQFSTLEKKVFTLNNHFHSQKVDKNSIFLKPLKGFRDSRSLQKREQPPWSVESFNMYYWFTTIYFWTKCSWCPTVKAANWIGAMCCFCFGFPTIKHTWIKVDKRKGSVEIGDVETKEMEEGCLHIACFVWQTCENFAKPQRYSSYYHRRRRKPVKYSHLKPERELKPVTFWHLCLKK